jgi:hypothetical protein
MTILGVVLMWLVCGIICHVIYKYAPQIPNGFKVGIYLFLLGVCAIYTLSALGMLNSLNTPVPKVG